MEEKELKNCYKNESIILEYIPKTTIFKVQNSPAKDGIHEKAKRSLPCPVNLKTGTRLKFLTEDEIAFLGDQLGADISFNRPGEYSFWDTYRVGLTGNTRHLDLTNAVDYIDWKALQCWPFIAKTYEEEKLNPNQYSWRLIRPKDVNKSKNKLAVDKSNAWMIFGENKKNKEALLYVYYNITGKVLDYNIESGDLLGYYNDVIDKNAASFIFQMEQNNLDTRAMLYTAWVTGVVSKKGTDFMYNGEKLAGDKEEATIEVAANYLLKPINQKILFEIEAQYKKKLES